MWSRYVDEMNMNLKHARDSLKNFDKHLNLIDETIQFTKEIEHDDGLPLLDMLVY